MGHYSLRKTHLSQLRVGDTVLIDGEMQTVGKSHLTKSELFGLQYKGYCYYETRGFLDVVKFPMWHKGQQVI